jgi:hypothetical protein
VALFAAGGKRKVDGISKGTALRKAVYVVAA